MLFDYFFLYMALRTVQNDPKSFNQCNFFKILKNDIYIYKEPSLVATFLYVNVKTTSSRSAQNSNLLEILG